MNDMFAPPPATECPYSTDELQRCMEDFLGDVATMSKGYSTGAANIRDWTTKGWFSPELVKRGAESLLQSGVHSEVAQEAASAMAVFYVHHTDKSVSMESIPPVALDLLSTLTREDLRNAVSTAIVDEAIWRSGHSRVSLKEILQTLETRLDMITNERRELSKILSEDRSFLDFTKFMQMVPEGWNPERFQPRSSMNLMPARSNFRSAFSGGIIDKDPLREGLRFQYPEGERHTTRWMLPHGDLLPDLAITLQNFYISDEMCDVVPPQSLLHHEVTRDGKDPISKFALEYALVSLDQDTYPVLKQNLFDSFRRLGAAEEKLVTFHAQIEGRQTYPVEAGLRADLARAQSELDQQFDQLSPIKKAFTKKEALLGYQQVIDLQEELVKAQADYDQAHKELLSAFSEVITRYGEIAVRVNELSADTIREKMKAYAGALTTYLYLNDRDRSLAWAEQSDERARSSIQNLIQQEITPDITAPTGINLDPAVFGGETVERLLVAEMSRFNLAQLSRLCDRASHVATWLAEEGQAALKVIETATDSVIGHAQVTGVREKYAEIWNRHSRNSEVMAVMERDYAPLLAELENTGLVKRQLILGRSRLGDDSKL